MPFARKPIRRLLSSSTANAKRSPTSAVFIYYAGHGTTDGSHFYFLPHDYRGGDPAASGIADTELQRILEKIDAGRIVLVIDACDSGQVLESADVRPGPLNGSGLSQLAYDKNMYVLAASQAFQAAKETNREKHGLLTYALIQEGLIEHKGDSAPQDGEITLDEWFSYAARRVPELDREARPADRGLIGNAAGNYGQRPRVFFRKDIDIEVPLVGTALPPY